MPSLPVCKTPLDAAKALLDQLLAAPAESALVKALGEPGDDKTKEFLRDVASKAAVAMIKGPGADKAPELLKAFEAVLDDPPKNKKGGTERVKACLLYTSPSPRDRQKSRMPSSA